MAHLPKKDEGFRGPLEKRTGQIRRKLGKGRASSLPKTSIEDIEDLYTSVVIISGVSEELFWHADLSFVLSVTDNKRAFDEWMAAERDLMTERR